MARRSLRWQLYPSYLLIIILAVIVTAWWAIKVQRTLFLEQIATDLTARAVLTGELIRPYLEGEDHRQIESLVRHIGEQTATRVTVVLPDGVVVGDSEEDPGLMENHGARPEILQALRQQRGSATRYSNTLQKNMMYVAVRRDYEDKALAVVRTAVPVTFIDDAYQALRLRVILGGVVVALLAALVSYWVSHRIARPLEHLRRGAKHFARGNLSGRLAVPKSKEIGGLAEAMNEMAAQLHQRINTITKQRQEQQAVLSSMVEGVLAVDTEEHLIDLNQAAADLLGLDKDRVIGLTVQEAVRITKLQEIVAITLATRKTSRGEIALTVGGTERQVQVSATILRDADGTGIGGVVVLNDMTRLRQLENVRREFVANVSHELKTPITSIKGSVETLIDVGFDNLDDARRFLAMILRQADQLHQIVEDLLSLSRIEQGYDETGIDLSPKSVRAILDDAALACGTKAADAGVAIEVQCHDNLVWPMMGHLMQQALTNLIDNAVKYSTAGQVVRVGAQDNAGELILSVIDKGVGIPEEHHERLFERFYRVDKARSRQLGGTGLGLAIVKHIALAHGGRVDVISAPNEGSTFSIYLPEVSGSEG